MVRLKFMYVPCRIKKKTMAEGPVFAPGRGILPKPVLKNPHLFNKLSKLFRDVKFWSAQTQNSVETLFLSERANPQLFRTPKIFEIDALFVMLEGFLY